MQHLKTKKDVTMKRVYLSISFSLLCNNLYSSHNNAFAKQAQQQFNETKNYNHTSRAILILPRTKYPVTDSAFNIQQEKLNQIRMRGELKADKNKEKACQKKLVTHHTTRHNHTH